MKATVAFVVLLWAANAFSAQCDTVAQDLAVMVSADQALRSRWNFAEISAAKHPPKIVQQTAIVDRQNTAKLKRIMADCGWPKRSIHSDKAVHDAWLIAQHADHDRPFQRQVLVAMEAAFRDGEAPGDLLAYLADRVATADGKPQPYGTQLRLEGPCEFVFYPLDERDKVEVRRKDVGLPPLEEYRRAVQRQALPTSCASPPLR